MKTLYLRSGGILLSLYVLFFAVITGISFGILFYFGQNLIIGGFTVSPLIIGIVLAFVFITIQFLISPWILDLQLSWLYDMDWIAIDELPQDMAEALKSSMDVHGFTIAKIGLINDQTPNAFTYGRFTKNARIVFTKGLIDILKPEERVAVLKHEVGHIVNKDFIFMTLAQAIPLLLFYIYIYTRIFGVIMLRSKGGGKNAQGFALAVLIVAILSYIAYFVSSYIVLFLSRSREYLADHFSVLDTGNANAMSSALVKVSYGMVIADTKQKEQMKSKDLSSKEIRKVTTRNQYMSKIGAMGLADIKSARGLVMQSYAQGQEASPEAVAAAAAWDLQTPWAKIVELGSTHPLTGKRLMNLDRLAPEVNQGAKYPLLKTAKVEENLWDEFFADILASYIVPWFYLILPIGGALLAFLFNYDFLIGLGIGLLLAAILWRWVMSIHYPSKINEFDKPDHPHISIVEALTDLSADGYIEGSPVRGKPIVLQGRIIGRGTPGYYLNEDFVLQDETGLIIIDFQSIFGLFGNFYRALKQGENIGKTVRLVGWYHRSHRPFIKLFRAYLDDGKVIKDRRRAVQIFINFLFLFAGIGCLIASFIFTFVLSS